MAAEGEIYLGPYGIESEEVLISTYAKEVTRSFEEFGRSERTYGGVLKTDITSRKYTFTIAYEYIDQNTLNDIYDNYIQNIPLVLKMYITDLTYFTNFDSECPIVKMQPFSFVDFRTGFATKIYKSLSLSFVEI